jgi:hypothetical protein
MRHVYLSSLFRLDVVCLQIGGRTIPDKVQFFYRTNADKTIDSICGLCYLTVARGKSEAELHAQEAAHDCWKKKSTNNQPGSE